MVFELYLNKTVKKKKKKLKAPISFRVYKEIFTVKLCDIWYLLPNWVLEGIELGGSRDQTG